MQTVPFPDARVLPGPHCLYRGLPGSGKDPRVWLRKGTFNDDNIRMKRVDSVPLEGVISVVTGGGRGIGLAIVRKLAGLGAHVVLTGRDEALVKKIAADLTRAGQDADGVRCDVSDLDSVETLGKYLQKTYGRVDILVNNAGIGGPSGELHKLAPADWDAILNTNLRGAYYMMRAVVPIMIGNGGGHIINISSLAGKNPLPRGVAYSASKWGLNGLSYGAAEELRSHNIRVSVVCPGSVNTEFSPHTGKSADKMLQPDDVAHAVESLVTQTPQSFMSEILLRPTQKPRACCNEVFSRHRSRVSPKPIIELCFALPLPRLRTSSYRTRTHEKETYCRQLEDVQNSRANNRILS
jgi:3-oxoacyl-[acyl-carrier protein] reductase